MISVGGSIALASSICWRYAGPRPSDAPPRTDRRTFHSHAEGGASPAALKESCSKERSRQLTRPRARDWSGNGGFAVPRRYQRGRDSGCRVRSALARTQREVVLDEVPVEQEGDFDADTRFGNCVVPPVRLLTPVRGDRQYR